ncbi:MAG: carbohydrate ABC transporter permease [Anaerolineae bacterium]
MTLSTQCAMEPPRARHWRSRGRSILLGLFFVSPWLLALAVLILYPVGASFYYSFTNYNVLQPPDWIGIENYKMLMLDDATFRISVVNTVTFALMYIPSATVVGIGLGLLLNANIRGMTIFRSLYFLPVLVPAVAAAVLWRWIFHPQWGAVNALLKVFSIRGPGWLADPVWSKPTLVLMALWMLGQTVVIYLASLQDVPRELYDAAEVDGANNLQRVWYVTLPIISPVIFFNIITGLIFAFQYFTEPFVISNGIGTPAQSLMFYGMYLYRLAFLNMNMGAASAVAWMLFVAVLVCTLVIFRTANWWVYYASAEEGV